jgi:predicted enzyme related to lactoylglutathione lyase
MAICLAGRSTPTARRGEGVGGGVAKPPAGGPYTTFYVNCDDVQAKLSEAERLGAKVVMPPMQVPDGPEIAMFPIPTATSASPRCSQDRARAQSSMLTVVSFNTRR